jgi:VWFA-related protein
LKPGSTKQHLDDAAMEGINMLRTRGKDRKRVLLLISESRDSGSRFSPRDVLTRAELSDVQIHPVSMSHLINILTTPALPNRPNPVPPEQRNPLPMGNLQTPTSDAQTNMGNYVPLFKEIFEAGKGTVVPNSLEVYSKFTGGNEQDFVSVTGLEEAIARIGEEIHTQYLLTFTPQASAKSGYHRIEVKVLSAANYKITTRGGYWWAPSVPDPPKPAKKK